MDRNEKIYANFHFLKLTLHPSLSGMSVQRTVEKFNNKKSSVLSRLFSMHALSYDLLIFFHLLDMKLYWSMKRYVSRKTFLIIRFVSNIINIVSKVQKEFFPRFFFLLSMPVFFPRLHFNERWRESSISFFFLLLLFLF
jgi:hypothetical protein